MKKFLLAILLLFSTLSFADQKPFQPEFVERYKNQGHENFQIIGYSFQVSAFNFYVHKLYKLNPELADRYAKIYKIIENDDTLANAYTPEANRVILERHKTIAKCVVILTYLACIIMFLFAVISIVELFNEWLQGEATLKAVLWVFTTTLGFSLTLPAFDGGANTVQLLTYKIAFNRLSVSQYGLSTHLAALQKAQFNITKDDYKGMSEDVIAQQYTKFMENIALQYLQSSKYYFRNNDPTDIYANPEDFVHINDDIISFYMPPASLGYRGQSLSLFKAGSVKLSHVDELPKATVDAIYPVVITPVDSEGEIAEKASAYETELRANNVSEEHIKVAMFYFHDNSVLNVIKKTVTQDFVSLVKAAEFTEAVKCETESERRQLAQNSINKGFYENNYCLYKTGGSIKLMNATGNLEEAHKILDAFNEKIYRLRLATSQSFYSSLQNTETNKLLVDALHYGTKFYFSNYARIKHTKETDNVLAVLLNNNMSFNALGRDSFIDDAALTSRKNDSDLMNLNDAYAAVVAKYNAKPNSMMEVDLSETVKEYLTNKSNTTIDSSDSSTLFEVIKTVAKEIRKVMAPPTDCKDNCHIALDNSIMNQKIGAMLINYGVMLKSTKYALSFMDTSNDVKASKADAKNNQSGLIKTIKKGKAMFSSLKGMVNGLISMLAPIDPIANIMIVSGIGLDVVVPNIPSIAFNITESIFYTNFVLCFIYSILIFTRLARKNDEDNWQYIATATIGIFGTVWVAPILLETSFYILTETSGYLINEMTLMASEFFIKKAMQGDIWEMIAHAVALLMFIFVIFYSFTMMFIRLYLAATIQILKALHVPTEMIEKAFEVLNFIDFMVAIVCPFVFMFIGLRIGAKKALKNAKTKKPKTSSANSKTA